MSTRGKSQRTKHQFQWKPIPTAGGCALHPPLLRPLISCPFALISIQALHSFWLKSPFEEMQYSFLLHKFNTAIKLLCINIKDWGLELSVPYEELFYISKETALSWKLTVKQELLNGCRGLLSSPSYLSLFEKERKVLVWDPVCLPYEQLSCIQIHTTVIFFFFWS